MTWSIALYFSSFSFILIALSSLSEASLIISSRIESSIIKCSYSIFSTPTWAIISSWNSHNSLTASCPNINASSISSSDTSFAPASTILIAYLVPATVKSISDTSSSLGVGFIINLPSILPTLTPAIGPSKGILDIHVESDDPNIAVSSGE